MQVVDYLVMPLPPETYVWRAKIAVSPIVECALGASKHLGDFSWGEEHGRWMCCGHYGMSLRQIGKYLSGE